MKEDLTIIIGLGVSGYSCAEFLSQQHIPFIVMDTRLEPPKLETFKKQFPLVEIYTGSLEKSLLSKAKTLILSPGISPHHPDIVSSISHNTEVIGDIELFAREVNKPIIAITGSNGKTTVTTLVGEMAKAAHIKVGVGGNIGLPALDLIKEQPDLYVLELSSFQLETTFSLKAKVATILNLSADHMDRYDSIDDYRKAKYRIYHQAQQLVINREDVLVSSDLPHKPFVSFGLNTPLDNHYGISQENGKTWLTKGNERLLSTDEMKLFGRHNIANVLAALALGDSVNIPLSSMLSTLKTFAGLPHRCEWVREINGIPWINDSKGTNVGATEAALKGLTNDISGKWVLIAGGVGKNADFSSLKSLVETTCRAVVLVGEAADQLYDLFSDIPCFKVNSMKDAVDKAFVVAHKGDGVLLSPACASLDMFKNFEERGNIFKAAVLAL